MKQQEELGNYMSDAGIKPSYQRLQILAYLYNNKEHPTVDMIFRDLKKEISTLSKTTVYNTMKLFVDHGIVNALSIDGNETRYDYNTETHGHFKCELCSELYDFEFDDKDIQLKSLRRHDVQQVHLYVKGVCENCLKTNSINQS
jgi:Fe2+ or Zn2+ uptake regulation protein